MNKFTKTIVVLASVIITPAILFFLTYVIFESGLVEYKASLFQGEEFYVFGKRVDSWFGAFKILVWGSYIASIPLGIFIGCKLIKRPDNISSPTVKTKNVIPVLTVIIVLASPFFGAVGIFLLSGPQAPNLSIHKAVIQGNTEAVKKYIASGIDVNTKDGEYGMTPLHAAIPAADYDSHNEIIELLIAKGAIVNTKNIDDETPLDGAIRQKKTKVADLLLKHGAKSGAEDSIHVAAGSGNVVLLKKHLDAGVDVSAKNKAGMTPLLYAATSGHKEIAEFLITKGADVNAIVATGPKKGKTPLDAANGTNHPEVADLLRKHGGKTAEELKAEAK